jgi:hypothetical protein
MNDTIKMAEYSLEEYYKEETKSKFGVKLNLDDFKPN